MVGHDTERTRPRGGLPDKRRAILAGALAVFARDGYTRASVDAIAAEAGVSTRTIYNHFHDKAELFREVIMASATSVAEAQIALMDRHLSKVRDLRDLADDLVEFGLAWRTPMPDAADHFALVRQVNAEAGHIPPAAIEAWQAAGPLRVRRELARRFRQLAERGLLRVDDADVAALHFALLISGAEPSYRGTARTDQEIAETVASGVRAFLHGYLR